MSKTIKRLALLSALPLAGTFGLTACEYWENNDDNWNNDNNWNYNDDNYNYDDDNDLFD